MVRRRQQPIKKCRPYCNKLLYSPNHIRVVDEDHAAVLLGPRLEEEAMRALLVPTHGGGGRWGGEACPRSVPVRRPGRPRRLPLAGASEIWSEDCSRAEAVARARA